MERITDVCERNDRIEQHLPLVSMVLSRMAYKLPSHVDRGDLHSAGITGLIAAADRFDPSQSQSFAGYVRVRIRGAILDELRRLDPSSRRGRTYGRKIRAAVQEAEQKFGRAPTDEEVGDCLNISVQELELWHQKSRAVHVVSLDETTDTTFGPGNSLHELLADGQEDVRQTMEKEELHQLLTARIADLPEQQKRILAFYYFEGMTYAEIGEALGVTESRICQIHGDAVTALKRYVLAVRKGF